MMDPPPPQPSAAPPPSSPAINQPHNNYPDSVESSPRSRNTDTWDEPLAPPTISRVRLMCSYGGHIVPRPHDKSLCYVGGDTRIVVVDRNTSLLDLSNRLSKTLLNGRPFTLKYQLPNEDLDSLISVTTDEDLDNMIDEYDRTASNSSNHPSVKPSRLRLFLFPSQPEVSQSIGPILDSSGKSEDWFLSALNVAGLLNRGFSDSASVNCLLGLDDDGGSGRGSGGGGGNKLDSSGRDAEASQTGSFKNGKQQGQDVHSVPDSPMLETSSSFGSTSSSPSLANLPPIRVHVEDGSNGGGAGIRAQDQKMGIEEQFAQINIGGLINTAPKQQDEGNFVIFSSPPPMPATIVPTGAVPPSSFPVSSGGVISGDYTNRVISDDERSDHNAPLGFRKQPQSNQKSTGFVELQSPDSVSSDGSITNPLSRSKPIIYQDPVIQIPSTTTKVQESGYLLQPQFNPQQQPQHQPQNQPQHQPQNQPQHQFIQANTHYMHQQFPAYYHPVQQQYPVYYIPSRQAPVQAPGPAQSQAQANPSSQPQTPPSPAMVGPSHPHNYNPARNPPIAADSRPSPMVQVPAGQPQQYVAYSHQGGYSHMHHPSQQVQGSSSFGTSNFGYEFADPTAAHATPIYYTQHLAPSQYQTMAAPAAMVVPESSGQVPSDNMKRQQIRTSQPL